MKKFSKDDQAKLADHIEELAAAQGHIDSVKTDIESAIAEINITIDTYNDELEQARTLVETLATQASEFFEESPRHGRTATPVRLMRPGSDALPAHRLGRAGGRRLPTSPPPTTSRPWKSCRLRCRHEPLHRDDRDGANAVLGPQRLPPSRWSRRTSPKGRTRR